MIKNILITGGAGYIGSHISEILVKDKKKVFIVDNLSTDEVEDLITNNWSKIIIKHYKKLHKKSNFPKIILNKNFKGEYNDFKNK